MRACCASTAAQIAASRSCAGWAGQIQREISAGGEPPGGAWLRGGTAAAWGSDDVGQLGNGTTGNPEIPAPVTVFGLSNAIQLAVDGAHVLALAG